jgi:hypothetical protein
VPATPSNVAGGGTNPRAAAAGTRKSPSTAYDLKFVCSDLRAKAKCALSLDIEPISIRGGKAPLLSYRSASIFAKLCYVEYNFETPRHSAEVSKRACNVIM